VLSAAPSYRLSDLDSLPGWQFQSALPGVAWPAVSTPAGSAALALLFQLEQTQWLTAAELAARQLAQLDAISKHAYTTVPFYREHWQGKFDASSPMTASDFAKLPVLGRRDLQSRFEALLSQNIPAAHGVLKESRTSGSSGTPLRVVKTELTQLFWNALTLREHIWHCRDLNGKLAAIRAGSKGEFESWGQATYGLVATGPSVVKGIRTDVPDLLDWLALQNPDYLLTYPSILRELLIASRQRAMRLPALREVRTFGELLPPDVRNLCRQSWNRPIVDVYSAEEVGHIALQCPESEYYHVQSESILVEVLNERNEPSAPGETGRVVVTTLHNFAMPLIRYELGDYAEVGEPCPCGRGLPVLRRVVGRVINMLVTAAGERYWPIFGMRTFQGIEAIRQHQFVQKQFDVIEARLVTSAPLGAELEDRLRRHMQAHIPPGIRIEIVYCEEISRGTGGKYEDFISEVAGRA
jgi:phenylacetate-CoA ligase